MTRNPGSIMRNYAKPRAKSACNIPNNFSSRTRREVNAKTETFYYRDRSEVLRR